MKEVVNINDVILVLVAMHIESLEEVYRETKDAPTYKVIFGVLAKNEEHQEFSIRTVKKYKSQTYVQNSFEFLFQLGKHDVLSSN